MSSRLLKGVAALALAMPIAAAGISSASAAQTDPCGAITDEPRCKEGGMDLKLNEPSGDYVQGTPTPDNIAAGDTDAQASAQCDVGDEFVSYGYILLDPDASGATFTPTSINAPILVAPNQVGAIVAGTLGGAVTGDETFIVSVICRDVA